MKKYIIPILGLFLLFACSEKEETFEGVGTLKMDLKWGNEVVVGSRAGESDTDLLNSSTVTIYNYMNDVEASFSGSSIPSDIMLREGDYTVVVEAGESADASFDKIAYRGEQEFTIVANQVNPVSVECFISNALVTVTYHSSLAKAFTTYETDVFATENAVLNFGKDNAGSSMIGYFTLDNSNQLAWSFTGKNKDGGTVKDGNVFTARPTTQYNLTFKLTSDGSATGDAKVIELIVDEQPLNTINENVVLYQRPVIEGVEFDLAEVQVLAEDNPGAEYRISVKTTTPLQSLIFSGEKLNEWYGSDEVDLIVDEHAGVHFELFDEEGFSGEVVLFGDFISNLTAAKGTYSFNLKAVDTYKVDGVLQPKEREVVIRIMVTDGETPALEVTTEQMAVYDVWATKTTLKASFDGALDGVPAFQYREVGDSSWQTVEATVVNQNKFIAEIASLTPDTEYEYQAMVGEVVSTVIATFTTEKAAQLPNSSFEGWTTATAKLPPTNVSKTWDVPNAPGDDKFWDTGNMGAAAAGAKLTTKNTNTAYVTKGNSSIKLESMKAEIWNIGRFAAGNIFTGEFEEILIKDLFSAATAGGRLSFGKPFTSRPIALKGKYQYTCGGKISVDSKVTIPADLIADGANKDSNDKAAIYIALSDKGSPYPIVNTTAKGDALQYFDKNDANIIAFGEWEETETTTGMQEFRINLDYRHLNRIPTHIIVVCSSSKYGDYFTGAIGSTLYLDDFELVYE